MAADTQLYLIVGGVAAIVLAVLWRTVVRHGQLTRLQRRLRDDADPAERARAGNELVDLGLRRAAPVVLQAMPDETDDRVRRSIALAVARRQWEPSGAARVGQLRRWAAEQLGVTSEVTQFGPAVTRLSDMGGPRPPRREPLAPTTEREAQPPTEPVPPAPSLVGADEDSQWTPRDDATA
ncbi:MAG TPA: hypothetical protein VGU73_02330 [Acidimicrobiia bacterium]|nr:hypothetical protein [Acidimicrobiia bacterium]